MISISLILPSSILAIACDAVPKSFQISIADVDSCPEYDRWQRLRRSGLVVDFRRICRFDSGLPSLSDCLFNLSGFLQGSYLNDSDRISTQICHRLDDEHAIVVKSIGLSAFVNNYHFERRIEDLMNFRHPCVAGAIGVVLPSPLNGPKIVRMHLGGESLSTVVSVSPEWWTPTAKAKAVVGIILGLRFVHSLGLVHGHLTGNNILFNENRVIQISDFCMNGLRELTGHQKAEREADFGGFSGESWTPKADVTGFIRVLSEIVIGTSAEQGGRDPSIATFVSEIIAEGQCPNSKTSDSFADILNTLKEHDFRIIEGVDFEEVSNFVSWIEWSERLIE